MKCGYYYGLLNVDQQIVYKTICCAVAHLKEDVNLHQIPMNELRKICMAITYDNPELFYWIPSMSEFRESKLVLKYRLEKEAAKELIAKIRCERDCIIEKCIQEGVSSTEEILAMLYKYFAEYMEYAAEELKTQESQKWIYDIEGVFVNHRAVCLGIAQAWNYICQYLEIPSILVTGEAKLGGTSMNHAWNLVQLNGKYRHIDVTSQIYEKDSQDYQYFLLQDWEFNDRKWPEDTYPPAA